MCKADISLTASGTQAINDITLILSNTGAMGGAVHLSFGAY